jgi:adenylosuccinate synthase
MPGIVLVGLQWGDEGKGKASAYISRGAGLTVRFNGGANAGHTVSVGGKSFSLHMIPAGAVSSRAAALGPGVYLDLEALIKDLEQLEQSLGRIELVVSPRAHLVLDLHKELDKSLELLRSGERIGTTLRGIGPAAMHKYARLGLRLCDILEEDAASLSAAHLWRSLWEGLLGRVEEAWLSRLRELAERVRGFVGDVGGRIERELCSGGKVVFEGAQGTMLDIEHGTYPYVTSSHTVSASASTGSGVGIKAISRVIGVAKSYTTRVGAGPFPTELHSPIADELRRRGGEYGATTGRPRRIGWLDAVQLRYACRLNSVDEIFLTRVDTLSGLPGVKVCLRYDGVGEGFPETVSSLQRALPIYREIPGWPPIGDELRERLRREGYGALPREARRFVELVEEELGVPVRYIGVGPGVEDVVEK